MMFSEKLCLHHSSSFNQVISDWQHRATETQARGLHLESIMCKAEERSTHIGRRPWNIGWNTYKTFYKIVHSWTVWKSEKQSKIRVNFFFSAFFSTSLLTELKIVALFFVISKLMYKFNLTKQTKLCVEKKKSEFINLTLSRSVHMPGGHMSNMLSGCNHQDKILLWTYHVSC